MRDVSSSFFMVHGSQQGWAVLVGLQRCLVHFCQQGWAVFATSLLCLVHGG